MNFTKAQLRRIDIRLLWLVCLAVAAFRVFTLVRWGNSYLWPDEIYQSLEQSHRLVFGYGIVPWEYRDAVRSWVFPGTLAIFMALGAPLAEEKLPLSAGVQNLLARRPPRSGHRPRLRGEPDTPLDGPGSWLARRVQDFSRGPLYHFRELGWADHHRIATPA